MNNLQKLVRPNINKLKPYQCARMNTNMGIMLDANENPYGKFNRYPDPFSIDVRSAISKYINIDDKNIFVCNGSDESIDLLIRAFCEPNKDNIFVKKPTYGMYEVSANINNIDVVDVVNKNTKIIFLCSPNNPSGEILNEKEILNYCKNNSLVVIDEAYIEFSKSESFVKKIKLINNLVVLRTLSKAWGAAGIRLGYCVANNFVINVLNKIKYPYNVNLLTQKMAVTILKTPERMKKQVAKILKEKGRVSKKLKSFGLNFTPSEANFLLFKIPQALEINKKLEEMGVIIRDRTNDFKNSLRVTIGTKKENDKFLNSLEKSLLKIAFIDRDGVIIFEPQDDFQIDSLKKYRLLPGVIDGMKKLMKEGYELVMVTNQNGIGTLSFPEKDFLIVQGKLIKDLNDNGILFKEIFVCPHFEKDNCNCRKPKTGMVNEFLAENPINYKDSFMIGDRNSDIEFGKNIGISSYKIKTNSDGLFKIINKIL